MKTRSSSHNISDKSLKGNRLGDIYKEPLTDAKIRYALCRGNELIESWIVENNQLNGYNYLYDHKGYICRKTLWENGIIIGLEEFFIENIRDCSHEYKNGEINIKIEYYPDQTPRCVTYFSYGQVHHKTLYDAYGNIIPMDEN